MTPILQRLGLPVPSAPSGGAAGGKQAVPRLGLSFAPSKVHFESRLKAVLSILCRFGFGCKFFRHVASLTQGNGSVQNGLARMVD